MKCRLLPCGLPGQRMIRCAKLFVVSFSCLSVATLLSPRLLMCTVLIAGMHAGSAVGPNRQVHCLQKIGLGP